MRVSDASIAERILTAPVFQVDGKFSPQLYERFLRNQGMSPAFFEAQLRKETLTRQLRLGIEQTAFATAPELDRYLRLQNQKRDFGFLTFPVQAFAAKVQISEDEVKRFYEENKTRFMQPETVRIAYVELSADALAASTPVDEQEVRKYYEEHQVEFVKPEARRASHILFSVAAGASAEAEQAARNNAEEVRKRLEKGESFETLAKQLSQDTVSAKQGGDLGFWKRKAGLDTAFEERLFTLKKGELSEPVRSVFGYHIIRLDDIQQSVAEPYEKVRDQIQKKVGEEKARERFYDLAEKLNELTYEHPETLQNAKEELNLTIQHSGYFGRGSGQGIAANPKVVQAAFSEDVLEKGNNSSAIEITPAHVVVLRVEDRRPEAQRPLDEVRGPITEQLRGEKARAAARAAAEKALATLKGGTVPTVVAQETGAEWKTVTSVVRTDTQLPRPVVEAAFRMPRPKASAPSLDRASLPSGDEAVVVLSSVQDGAGAAPEDKPAEKGMALLEADAVASYEGMVATLRKNADIKIHKEQAQEPVE
jgi:peptidyl-prolyl cis-trans isomerase D